MESVDRELQVRRFVDKVWNGRDYEFAAELYGEKYTNTFGTGPSARVGPIRRYHTAFPDLHLEIEELIVAGDTVILRLTFRGTDTGGYLGRSPTGRAVEEWVVTIMHFEGDKVVREWIGADKLGLFIQLGVVDNHGPISKYCLTMMPRQRRIRPLQVPSPLPAPIGLSDTSVRVKASIAQGPRTSSWWPPPWSTGRSTDPRCSTSAARVHWMALTGRVKDTPALQKPLRARGI